MCERAATAIALLALLWVLATLWVLGEFYGDIDREDDV